MRKLIFVSWTIGLVLLVTISLSHGKTYQKVLYKNSTHIAGEDGQDYTIEDYKKKCNCSKLMEYKETTYSEGPAEESEDSYAPAKTYEKKTVHKTVYAAKPASGAQKKDSSDAIQYNEDDDDQGMKYATKVYKKEEKKYTTPKKVYKTTAAYEQEEEYQPEKDEYKTTKAYAKMTTTYAPKKAPMKSKYEIATMDYDEDGDLPYEEEEVYTTTKKSKTMPQYYKPAPKQSYKTVYKTTEAPYEEEESYETTKAYKTPKPYKKEYKTTTEAYQQPEEESYEEYTTKAYKTPKKYTTQAYEQGEEYETTKPYKKVYKTTTEAYEEPQYEEKPKYEKKKEYKTTTEAYQEEEYETTKAYKKEYKTTAKMYEEPSYGSYGNSTGAVYEKKEKMPVYAEKQIYQTTKSYEKPMKTYAEETTKAYEASATYHEAAHVVPPVITVHQNKTHHTDIVVKIVENKNHPYYTA